MTGIPTAQDLAGSVHQLVSFPQVAFQISELLADGHSSAADLGELIADDPAMNSALLRVANSSFYGMRGGVSCAAHAATIVGMSQVRDLAFGICANATFKDIPNELILVEDFWKHSLYCAAAAQSIGHSAGVCANESLFTAGLLHDIGHLVMFHQAPDLSRESIQLALDESDGHSPYISEREVFGYDHMAVGAEMALHWKLPQFLIDCIQWHHEPYAYEGDSPAVLVVHLANGIADLAERGSVNLEDAPGIDERVFADLRFSLDDIARVVAETQESAKGLLRVFTS